MMNAHDAKSPKCSRKEVNKSLSLCAISMVMAWIAVSAETLQCFLPGFQLAI